MKFFLLGIAFITCTLPAFAKINQCTNKISGYKIVKNSIYPFMIDNDKACFFSFYTPNPELIKQTRGSGNLGNTLWYGYYKINNPSKIYEFPKPKDSLWGAACHLDAVSFQDINGDNVRDVTIISSCDASNEVAYRFPFIFIRKKNNYIFEENIYTSLYGFINLNISDIHAYIKEPDKYYQILRKRYANPK